MDLAFSPAEEAFRAEMRAFPKERLAPDLAEKVRTGKRLAKADLEGWHAVLNERGWYAHRWPKEWGGTDWTDEEAIQMHGGIGMTWELPLSHYAKRLTMIGHQLGDEDDHLERYVALGLAA